MSEPWHPTKAAHLISLALKEVGKPYRMGAEDGAKGKPLAAWDCSELAQYLLAAVGITQIVNGAGLVTPIARFDGAGNQYLAARHITIAEARKLPGALLFIQSAKNYPGKPQGIGHVAVSLGNGYQVEARGKDYGVLIGVIRPSFNLAAKIDELYTPANLA